MHSCSQFWNLCCVPVFLRSPPARVAHSTWRGYPLRAEWVGGHTPLPPSRTLTLMPCCPPLGSGLVRLARLVRRSKDGGMMTSWRGEGAGNLKVCAETYRDIQSKPEDEYHPYIQAPGLTPPNPR
eukprot:gene22664-biopygen4254